jgi:hypothetical protein
LAQSDEDSSGERLKTFCTNRWLVFVAAMWMQYMAGIGYLFGAISLVVKAALGYNQRQVAVLGDAKDLRDCFGFFAGLFNALCLFTVWETAARTRCMREAVRRARCTRQAGAGHRRRDRPHPTASLGGADAGEHARGSLHGALERRGACLLLIEDDRALLAPTHCVAHDLDGAQRHVEHGQCPSGGRMAASPPRRTST